MSLSSSLGVRVGTAWFGLVCLTAACGDGNGLSARLSHDAAQHSSDTDAGSGASGSDDAGEESTDTQEGADASQQPAPDASTSDASSASCFDFQLEFGRATASASSEVDKTCTQNSDCRVHEVFGSCREACTVSPVSIAGKADLDARVAAIEAELCTPFAAAGCVAETFDCRARDSEPRCVAGKCELKGAGCPDVVDDLEGKACDAPFKECWNAGWCVKGMRCVDDAKSGEYRWVGWYPLC